LSEILKLDTNNLQSRTELAKIYQQQGKLEEAIRRLEEYIEIAPNSLHPRIELARIYQRQGKFDEAAKIAEEVSTFDPLNEHAISELLAIWNRQGEKEKCAQRFMEFISQPEYQFSRYSQAPVFRFFQCCSAFNMREYAKQVFKRFQSQLDERNLNYYESNFLKY
jgi:tetratricopeptide (TPR) repeat protein